MTFFLLFLSILLSYLLFLLFNRGTKEPEEQGGCGCFFSLGLILWLISISIYNNINSKDIEEETDNKPQSTLVHYIYSNGKTVDKLIDNSLLLDLDTIYRGHKKYVYYNSTGRNLVKYQVKYTKSGYSDREVTGTLVNPGCYFFWIDDAGDTRMFQTPPASTTVTYHSSYGKNHQLDYTYIFFLDYLENIPEYVSVQE